MHLRAALTALHEIKACIQASQRRSYLDTESDRIRIGRLNGALNWLQYVENATSVAVTHSALTGHPQLKVQLDPYQSCINPAPFTYFHATLPVFQRTLRADPGSRGSIYQDRSNLYNRLRVLSDISQQYLACLYACELLRAVCMWLSAASRLPPVAQNLARGCNDNLGRSALFANTLPTCVALLNEFTGQTLLPRRW